MNRLVAVLAFAALAAANAGAELVMENVSWQKGKPSGVRAVAWEDAGTVIDGPPKLDSRLRARLTLKNRGPKPAEGILLRYSMTARVLPVSGDKTEGTWAIPFMVDEKRVPRVGPNKTVDVFLVTSPALELYFAKVARAGWWPDRVKLQVMVEPHVGATELQSLESVLEVSK